MILSCGEALIDMLPRQTEGGEQAFAPYAGGAVFNTAMALGRLGRKSAFFSGLSSDLFGDVLRETLAKSEVDVSHANTSDRPTTLAFVRLVDGQASYTFYDENSAGRMITEADLPAIRADALFFGGISLVGEPCGTTYEALQRREAPHAVTMIDPNIRTSFITDEASYRARIMRMMARADIVKLSDEDLDWLMEGSGTDAQARQIIANGAKLVCITEGAKGATGYTSRDNVFVPAHTVTVADTVGAGDTFNAGVLAALDGRGLLGKEAIAQLTADDVKAALELGVQCAAITVSRPGANPPWAHEL